MWSFVNKKNIKICIILLCIPLRIKEIKLVLYAIVIKFDLDAFLIMSVGTISYITPSISFIIYLFFKNGEWNE